MNLSLRTVRRPTRLGAVAVLTCGGLVLAACSSGTATTAGSGGSATVAAKDVKLAYIVKFGTVPYFVEEARGVREKAKELGVTVSVQDVAQDSNAALSAVDTAIAQGVKGIAIVVPDQKIGPAVLQKAKAAGVAGVAQDDPHQAAAGTAAPWGGVDTAPGGPQVGPPAG